MRFHTRNLLGLNVNVKQKQLFIMVMQKAMKKKFPSQGLKTASFQLGGRHFSFHCKAIGNAKQFGSDYHFVLGWWQGGRKQKLKPF